MSDDDKLSGIIDALTTNYKSVKYTLYLHEQSTKRQHQVILDAIAKVENEQLREKLMKNLSD